MKPKLLEANLQLNTVFPWLGKDASDDFYPDVFLYEDLIKSSEAYLTRRKFRIWQLDTLQHLDEYVPKKNRLLRAAHWLHPTHRVLFLAILHHFFNKIDIKLSKSLYSYRASNTENPDNHPFPHRFEGWKLFINDFRSAALADSTKAIVLTDLASYFDHIKCDKLIHRIENLLGAGITELDKQILVLLHNLINLWSNNGFGIPQKFRSNQFFR